MPVPPGLLQHKCACGGNPGIDGECAECREKRLQTSIPPNIQTKLTVNQPGDVHEQEADRVAEQVLRMPDTESLHSGELNRKTLENNEELSRQPMDEDEITLQAKESAGQTPQVTPELQTRINSIRDGGQPLPKSTRAFMEPRFGHDFSKVRIHTDNRADESAHAVNALAYTVGRDVVFDAGQYQPATSEGKRLLAHELTHVLQQTGQHNIRIQRKTNDSLPQAEWRRKLDEILPRDVGLITDIDRYLTLLEVFGEAALSGLVNKIYNDKKARELVREYGVPGIVALGDTMGSKGALDVMRAREAIKEETKPYSRKALELRSKKKTPYERPDRTRFNFCFIMGTKGAYKIADWFAKTYFSEIHEIRHVKSLCGLLEELRNVAVNKLADEERDKIGQVIIISHADKKGGFYFPLNDSDKNKYVTPDEITKILSPDWLEKTGIGCRFAARETARASDAYTHVIVKGCNLGQNQAAIDALRDLFGGQATVTAPKRKVELVNLGYGHGEKGRRTPVEAISWMVKNGYLPPEAEEWPEDKKKDFVLSLFSSNAKATGILGIPADYLVIDNELVPPSDPRYRENLAESKPPKGDVTP